MKRTKLGRVLIMTKDVYSILYTVLAVSMWRALATLKEEAFDYFLLCSHA
jgi:hypothetical protein